MELNFNLTARVIGFQRQHKSITVTGGWSSRIVIVLQHHSILDILVVRDPEYNS